MKKRNTCVRPKGLLMLIVFSFILFSCSQENAIENSNLPKQENFVALPQVKNIANSLLFPVKGKNLDANGSAALSSTKAIESIDEMMNKNGKVSFYVINYKEGGFVLLSADNRTQPILGYSDKNKFVVDESSYPPGLKYWVNDAKKQIADIQNSAIVQTRKEKAAWEPAQIQGVLSPYIIEPPEEECPRTEVETIGPLLQTTWYQTGGFNDELPYITCDGNPFQVYAGCVPIAMGQVMRYHQHPINYNWSAMPPTYATATTANFIKDIHTAISDTYNPLPDNLIENQPIYACDGTGVSAIANIGIVLKNEFNYTSADRSDYDRNVVVDNIQAGLPVILSGDNGSKGHMWVCDGYRITRSYNEDCLLVGYLHFYMHWGWGGSNNGWYGFDNFNPDSTHFNNNKEMIYNITP